MSVKSVVCFCSRRSRLLCIALCIQIVSVSEAWISIAILRLIENEKAVVEGAGATGLAAILAGLLPELQGKK